MRKRLEKGVMRKIRSCAAVRMRRGNISVIDQREEMREVFKRLSHFMVILAFVAALFFRVCKI